MKATDILKPKSKEDIHNALPIWYHINKSTPTASMFVFLRAGLLWAIFFIIIGLLFVAGVFVSIYRFNFRDYMDNVEDLAEFKFLDERLPHLIIKYGKIK